MKTTNFLILLLLLLGSEISEVHAQVASSSDNLSAVPLADRNVLFDISANGISKTIAFGPDLAWADAQNFRRNILFMGLDQIDIVRASFQPTYPLVNGTELTTEQMNDLNNRLTLINTYVGQNTDLALNCDHPWVDEWYVGSPARWEQLIRTTAQTFMDAGHNIVSIGAFNEPDYGWGQGSAQDMYDITNLMNNNSFYDNIRLSGGNTLNCDEAQPWYDFLVPAGITEGNTHQLAGSFNGFASFIENVRANGHHATLDELHNIVEALVGYEYGMQTGIWWADIDYASGEMVKAFDGERIGYAEHRMNWTAAAVYRTAEGKVQAFGGTSERQAVTTTYNYLSQDRVVYYDGYGPQREFVLELPGGAVGSYQNGQTNAERVINISWGDDIQPAINGTYKLVNKQTGQVMQVAGDSDGANVSIGNDNMSVMQQWELTPVDARVGGDFSYFYISPVSSSSRRLDLNNFSLDNEANIHIWSYGGYSNQQWYLEYDKEGWFYIRSRESSLCLDHNESGNVWQREKTGNDRQLWRLIPVDATVEFDAPAKPSNLEITEHPASIRLDWTASNANDLAGYTVLRAHSVGGEYNTIARGVTGTSFVDNTCITGETYYYVVRAEDKALNRSETSNAVSGATTGAETLVAHYTFNEDSKDITVNLNHSAAQGGQFVQAVLGPGLALNGTSDFVKLSPDIAIYEALTVSTWVNWAGFNSGQRLFEFSNGNNGYISLSPSISGSMEFTIKHNGTEQKLSAPALPAGEWAHVAVTLGEEGVTIYQNGQVVATSSNLAIKPSAIKPFLNYIGASFNSSKRFEGEVDDFRVYNYQLSVEEINALYNALSVNENELSSDSIAIWPIPVKDELHIQFPSSATNEIFEISVFNIEGRLMQNRETQVQGQTVINMSQLTSGIYILRMENSSNTYYRKIVIE